MALSCYACERSSREGFCRACWHLMDAGNRRELNLAYDEMQHAAGDHSFTASVRWRLARAGAAAAVRMARQCGQRRAWNDGRSWVTAGALVLRPLAPGTAGWAYATSFGEAGHG